MGCPTIYYKQALQSLAYYLTCHNDLKKAKGLYEERDIDRLEKIIIEQKQNLPIQEFFYDAGMAFMRTLNEANQNDGCDGFNACIGGLNMFENFIGLDRS